MPRKKSTPKVVRSRRPKGSGSSSPDKRRGGWKGKVPVGKHPVTKKTLYQYFSAPTQREVEDLMRTAKPPDPQTVTVGEWCDQWFAALKKKGGTLKVYQARLEKRIRPSFGAVPLSKLTAWDIEAAAAKWKGAPTTIRGTLETLGVILRAAMRARLISENPAALVRKPRPGEQEFDLFERAQLSLIVATGLTRPEWWMFAVLALTGMRAGESLALLPADFNPATLQLSITKTWTAEGIQDEPKTRLSRRTIDVDERLREVLTAGVPAAHYQTAADRWAALLKKLEFDPRGMHQLRHSFASYALADGTPVTDLAAFLGHTPAELLKTYAHKTGTDMRAVAARVVPPA